MILKVQKYQSDNKGKSRKEIADEFNISVPTLGRYLAMTGDDIQALERPHRSKRSAGRVMDDYVNMIYKMLRDGIDAVSIVHYVTRKGFSGDPGTIWQYIHSIALWNFPERRNAALSTLLKWKYPDDVIVIKRAALLKYILTVNPKTKKDDTITIYIDIVKARFPIVETTQTMFVSFHAVLMGGNANDLDGFLERYGTSEIKRFCDVLKQDMASVKNAITLPVSSGFVEGGNNKFKLIKREMYGRANLPHLSQKCLIGFLTKNQNFNLSNLT